MWIYFLDHVSIIDPAGNWSFILNLMCGATVREPKPGLNGINFCYCWNIGACACRACENFMYTYEFLE